jgi:AhpD family alkylhydroperoxidase
MSDTPTEACSEQEFAKRFPNEDADIKKMLGLNYVPKLFRAVVTLSPSLAVSTWQMVRGILCNGKLSRVLKEMIFIAVANTRDCQYCSIAHQAMALKYGLEYGVIHQVIRDLDQVQPPSTREILKFSVCLAQGKGNYSEGIDHMLKNGVKQGDIPEIIAMISCANYMVTLADGLMVVPDERFFELIEGAKKSAAA